jgi:hypothetical protein
VRFLRAQAQWVGGPNHGLMEWGEYERTSGWTFHRDLTDRIVLNEGGWGGPPGAWAARAVLSIGERNRRASSWRVRVGATCGGREAFSEHFRCRSIRSAQLAADEWVAGFDLAGFLRSNFDESSPFWSHVYRDDDWLMSVNDLMLVPSGTYLVRAPWGERQLLRSDFGYSTYPVTAGGPQ